MDNFLINWKVCDCFKEITNDLQHKNRFSNEKLDLLINKLVTMREFTYSLPKDTKIFRARIYDKEDAYEKFINQTGNETSFKGYSKEESMAPPPDKVSDGRCNANGIPWLYAAQSKFCALYEVKPSIGQYISIATIELKKEMKLFNMNPSSFESDKLSIKLFEDAKISDVIEQISLWLCRPIINKFDYIVSQYICEKIISKGFEGIAFNSSIYNGQDNKNYAIYNYSDCEATGSVLYRTKDIKFDFEKIDEGTGKITTIGDDE